jgi:hypothetical protein
MLVPSTRRNLCSGFGFAPAIGLCIVSVFAFPFYRHIGPVVVWNKAFLISLAFLSVAIVSIIGNKEKNLSLKYCYNKNLFLASVALVICWITLSLPFLMRGINYGHFGANPSDAFYYMCQAEAFKAVPWELHYYSYQSGFNHPDNLRIASLSPTALYSARFLHLGVRLATTLNLASASDLFNVQIYRLYGLFPIAYILIAVSLVFAIAPSFNLRFTSLLGLLPAIALGYWPVFMTRNDSLSQIAYLPIILLVLKAFLDCANDPLRWISPQRILLGLSITALITNYIEALPLVVLWFCVFYLWGIVKDRSEFSHAMRHVVTVAIVFGLLFVTSQFGNYLALFQAQTQVVVTKIDFGPFNIPDVHAFGLWNTIWGLVPLIRTAVQYFPSKIQIILNSFTFFAYCFLVLGAVVLYCFVKNSSKLPLRVLLAHLLGGCFLMLYILYIWNWSANRTHSKALFLIVHPIAILIFSMLPQYLSDIALRPGWTLWFKRCAYSLFGIWVAFQLIAAFIPALNAASSTSKPSNKSEAGITGHDYNVKRIIAHLKDDPPSQLVLDVPCDKEWPFPLYCIFAFAEFNPYFKNGVIFDNSIGSAIKTQFPPKQADWIITTPEVASISYKEASKVASNRSLVLLHTAANPYRN